MKDLDSTVLALVAAGAAGAAVVRWFETPAGRAALPHVFSGKDHPNGDWTLVPKTHEGSEGESVWTWTPRKQ